MPYLLSATEYAMAGCYVMLEEVMRELPSLDGIVMYSIFMLPMRRDRRLGVYERILTSGASLHGALENLAVKDRDGLRDLEDTIRLTHLMRRSQNPFGNSDAQTV